MPRLHLLGLVLGMLLIVFVTGSAYGGALAGLGLISGSASAAWLGRMTFQRSLRAPG